MGNLLKQEDLTWRGQGGSLISTRLPGTCFSQQSTRTTWNSAHAGLPCGLGNVPSLCSKTQAW